MKIKLQFFIILILGLVTLFNCSGPDPYEPLQTRILEVKVEPNPVAVGDTAKFTCIIEDSLDESFKYSWFLEADGILLDTVTSKNTIQWKAPDSTANYNHSVEAFNQEEMDTRPGRSFSIEVISN